MRRLRFKTREELLADGAEIVYDDHLYYKGFTIYDGMELYLGKILTEEPTKKNFKEDGFEYGGWGWPIEILKQYNGLHMKEFDV